LTSVLTRALSLVLVILGMWIAGTHAVARRSRYRERRTDLFSRFIARQRTRLRIRSRAEERMT